MNASETAKLFLQSFCSIRKELSCSLLINHDILQFIMLYAERCEWRFFAGENRFLS